VSHQSPRRDWTNAVIALVVTGICVVTLVTLRLGLIPVAGRWRFMIAALSFVPMVIVVLSLADGPDRRLSVDIDNRTDRPLVIEVTGAPDDHPLRRVSVGPRTRHRCVLDTSGMKPECVGLGAVAFDEAGTEVARLDEPLCLRHVWIFEPDRLPRYRHQRDADV